MSHGVAEAIADGVLNLSDSLSQGNWAILAAENTP